MELTHHDDDADLLRQVFQDFPSGVVALSAMVDGEPTVMVASSFSVGVSHNPPMVMFSAQNSSTTWPDLACAERIGVSVLGEAQLTVGKQLASRDKSVRFTGVSTHVTERGAILLDDAPVWMECSIEGQHPAGDHTVVIMRVRSVSSAEHGKPVVMHRYQFRMLA